MYLRLSPIRWFFALLCLTWLGLAQAVSAQAPAAPPPAYPAQPAPPPPQTYPPAPTYPQQAYPQQAYPQPAYPQQAYPQQAYPQQQPYPQMYQQQQVYPPPYAPPAPAPRAPSKPRLKRGMLAAGISVLAASYGISLITGAILVDTPCCERVGAMLMIPVAGPYLAAEAADDGKGLLVLLGTVQVVGTGLLIGGIVRYTKSKRAAEEQGYYAWKLPHERSLGVGLSSSPALVGPRLQLRF